MQAPRTEFAVGAFLLLALATLMALAMASTNGKFGVGEKGYALKAKFTAIGQLRNAAPVKIGGVNVGRVDSITLDPKTFNAVVTLAMDARYRDLPADTTAGIFTSGLLGESYVGLQPGGDTNVLKAGDEITFTQPAVDLMQLVGKYMFSAGPGKGGDDAATDAVTPDGSDPTAPADAPTTH